MRESEQLVQCHEPADRKPLSRAGGYAPDGRGETRNTKSLQRSTLWGVAVAVGSVFAFSVSPAAAKPCAEHVGKAKKACQVQLKRDRTAWPARPTEAEIKKRVGAYNWNKAARVANCETGGTRGASKYRGNLNWYPHGRYRGPLGMYRTTQDYGKRRTGYWTPRTWQEHVAIAVAAHPITRGWSGWGCGGA